MPDAAFDTDVLTKFSAYAMLDKAFAIVAGSDASLLLGAARFTVPAQLKRLLLGDSESKIAHFNKCIEQAMLVEPTTAEAELAAELELAAQNIPASLDAGESQLVAIVISRTVALLATGDKRAVGALHLLAKTHPPVENICGKIVCFEQLLLSLLKSGQAQHLHDAVCSNKTIDKAASICFACGNSTATADDWEAGLTSYIAALGNETPGMLAMVGS